MSSHYLAILKASYDYEPQSEDEIALKEDQLLFLIERTDEEWWKVKVKGTSQEDDYTSPTGLVPAAYVEPAQHISIVKALYDYEASASGELTISEDDILLVFDKDEDWLLVQNEADSEKLGYVPGNYVEQSIGDGGHSTEEASQIVVPPSPPPPTNTYVDPAERVAANKVAGDNVGIWPVSEVDKKGKKKKGTLGVGSGAVFFSSEADKTPVQKWQTSFIESVKIEKTKHVMIEIGGSSPSSLHFHAGSKDAAEEIVAKLELSKTLSIPSSAPWAESSPPAPIQTEIADHHRSVHFSTRPESIISPRGLSEVDESDPGAEAEIVEEVNVETESAEVEGEPAVALYDFTADGEDELSVFEGASLLVLDKDNDEWWKVRNEDGLEGVVPASYVELVSGVDSASVAEAEDGADKEEAERAAREAEAETKRHEAARAKAAKLENERTKREIDRVEKERKAADAERKAQAAEAERERKVREMEAAAKAEAERQRRREQREAERQRERIETEPRTRASKSENGGRNGSQSSRDKRSGSSRASSDRPRPAAKRIRVWHDRTGQFQVEAEFLGMSSGKIRLHKTNGVVIEVPAEKMSAEDMHFIDKYMANASGIQPRNVSNDDDDEPLEMRRRSLVPDTAARSPTKSAPPKKATSVDWFEFFLSSGCEMDDCTRYSAAFERDKIDESILQDITESTMRSLGLREGDIIRVKKMIGQRAPKQFDDSATQEQLRKDEELARQLQAEENGNDASAKRQTVSPAPNLFTSGPGGALKPRRGRPTPSSSAPPVNVKIGSITSASSQITRTVSPLVNDPSTATTSSPTNLTPVQPPRRSSSTVPIASGFDDDAWAPRPTSAKPQASTPPAVTVRAPSAPPAPTPTAPPPAPSSPLVQAKPNGSNLDSDIFEQLSRLKELKTQNQAVSSLGAPVQLLSNAASPPIASPPPMSFQAGLGMGTSPIPMGHHLQSQQTGMLQPSMNVPRGPFAPVPSNQGLLNPLIPTITGFNNFVPTRPNTASPFQPQAQQPSFLPSQPTGFVGSSRPLLVQPTGFSSSMVMPQQTGFPATLMGGFGSGPSPANISGFGSVQSRYSPGFGSGIFGNAASPPPVPPLPPNDHSPANVFAQMKSGSFASSNEPAGSHSADKYDGLRPAPDFNPISAQPASWGSSYQTTNGYQSGY